MRTGEVDGGRGEGGTFLPVCLRSGCSWRGLPRVTRSSAWADLETHDRCVHGDRGYARKARQAAQRRERER